MIKYYEVLVWDEGIAPCSHIHNIVAECLEEAIETATILALESFPWEYPKEKVKVVFAKLENIEF